MHSEFIVRTKRRSETLIFLVFTSPTQLIRFKSNDEVKILELDSVYNGYMKRWKTEKNIHRNRSSKTIQLHTGQ